MQLLFVLLAALSVGCPAENRTPADVVAAYFTHQGRDPIRTLELLAPEFHLGHGLRPGGVGVREAESSGQATGLGTVAWLAVQRSEVIRELAPQLRFELRSERGDELRWSLDGAVSGPTGESFMQRFELVRQNPAAPWRVRRIAQWRLEDGNLGAAFAAYPNERLRRSMAAAGIEP